MPGIIKFGVIIDFVDIYFSFRYTMNKIIFVRKMVLIVLAQIVSGCLWDVFS